DQARQPVEAGDVAGAFRGKLGHRRLKSSSEDAVHKPARRRVAGKAGAIKPEAPALLVLDTVIVADPVAAVARIGGAVLDPPFLGDAFGTVGMPDPVLTPPPREAKRRIVRQHPLRLDRLRRPEQPHGPRRFIGASVLHSPGWFLPRGAGEGAHAPHGGGGARARGIARGSSRDSA